MRISLVFPVIFLMVRRMRWWTALMPFVVASVTLVVLQQPAVKQTVDVVGFAVQGGLTAYLLTVHYLLAFAIGASLAHHRETLFAAYRRMPGRARLSLVLLAMLHLFAGRLPLGWLLLLTFVLCFVVSDLAWRLVEKPALTLSRLAADYAGRSYAMLRTQML